MPNRRATRARMRRRRSCVCRPSRSASMACGSARPAGASSSRKSSPRLASPSTAKRRPSSPRPFKAGSWRSGCGPATASSAAPLLEIESTELGEAQSDYLQRHTAVATASASIRPLTEIYSRIKKLQEENQLVGITEVQEREMELRKAEGVSGDGAGRRHGGRESAAFARNGRPGHRSAPEDKQDQCPLYRPLAARRPGDRAAGQSRRTRQAGSRETAGRRRYEHALGVGRRARIAHGGSGQGRRGRDPTHRRRETDISRHHFECGSGDRPRHPHLAACGSTCGAIRR